MEFFAARGRFWLPQLSQRIVHGNLTFNEDGVRLDLDDPLRAPGVGAGGIVSGSPEAAAEEAVHGRLRDGREVSLLRLRGLSMPVAGMQEIWFADFALSGGFMTGDVVSKVTVVFDYLMPWVQPTGIVRGDLFSSRFAIETERVTLEEADLDDRRKVRLLAGVAGRRASDAIHLDQYCALEVTGEEPKPILEVLNDWVRPLQDLLVVCTGQPVRLEEVLIRPPEYDPRRDSLELSFRAVQPAAGAHPTAAQLVSYNSPSLLTYATLPLPFSRLIRAWFGLYGRLPDAVTLLCGPYYAPFIYGSHRYASTFQSAEALARTVLNAREKPPRQHRARMQMVTAALDRAHVDPNVVGWATRILQTRNDKPLRQLMEELVSSTGGMGQMLLTAVPDLGRRLAAARASVSHPGTEEPGTLARYWLGEALIWVLRVRLLAELGVPISGLSASVTQKPAFQDVLRELASLAPSSDKPVKRLPRWRPWLQLGMRLARHLFRWLQTPWRYREHQLEGAPLFIGRYRGR